MKKSPLSSHPEPKPDLYPYYGRYDDELSLGELFAALWKGKWLISACTVFFAIVAIIFALTAQEWWTSKAVISEPQEQDFVAYSTQVKKVQPAFSDIYQVGTILVSDDLNDLDDLISSEELFKLFIRDFNSSVNKKRFLDENETFLTIKEKVLSTTDDEQAQKVSLQRLYRQWYDNINAVPVDMQLRNEYKISFQTMTKESSYLMLEDYMAFVTQVSRDNALSNLQAKITAKQQELEQQIIVLSTQAELKSKVDLVRTQYAYEIAESAGVDIPVQNLGENEVFAINLGSKALKAKIKVLKDAKDMSVFEPRLQQLNAQYSLLNNISVGRNVIFQTFRYLEYPEQPFVKDKPRRSLIVILGLLFGGMFGASIVMIRYVIRREK